MTFLFTDIEGSTRLWEQYPYVMRDALALHDEIMEREIESAGGFIYSTAGDAYGAAFSDPVIAMGAAVSAQRSLKEAAWPDVCEIRVRMALNTGVAQERDANYYGPPLNRCARMMSAAHGGQIVTSQSTEELVRGRLDPGTQLRDLGEHRLKDLEHPERIFQVVANGLDSEFGPLQTLDSTRNNLPTQATSFIGREDEIIDVRKRLGDARLLTLTGVGGSGKTRLALQVAAEIAEDFEHGVWLVELSAVSDPERLSPWVADSLNIHRRHGGGDVEAGAAIPIIDQIIEYLRPRKTLLILDNCEHLIAACGDLVTRVLVACRDVKILATSREGLGVPGETLWQVPSLEMPVGSDLGDLAGPGADALRLFTERAAAVNPKFEITSETYPMVLEICRRLDGMPLAIELAAARVRSLDVSQIAKRLDDRFRLLTGGSRTALPRQQTLAAAVEWSYDLLDQPEQILFQRLAVFRGGFTLEAAEQTCAGGGVEELDIVDHLTSLVDKSMVVWVGGRGERYGLLETLRQYAMNRLNQSGETTEMRQAHAQYFLELAQQAAPHLRGRGQVDWIEKLETEADNFRAALAFTAENDMAETTNRIAASLYWFWYVRNHLEDQKEWLGPLLGRMSASDDGTTLKLMLGYAWHLLETDQVDQLEPHIRDTLALAERSGDGATLSEAWIVASWFYLNTDEFDRAADAAERALEIAEECGDGWAIVWSAYSHGWANRMKAEVDEAAGYVDKAMAGARRIGDTLGLASSAALGAILARYRLDYPMARRLHEESLEGAFALGDRDLEAFNYGCIGIVDYLEGRYDDAVVMQSRALAIQRDIGATSSVFTESLDLLGRSQLSAGRTDEARRTLAEALDRLEAGLEDSTVLASLLETLASPLLDAGYPDLAGRFWGWAMSARENVERPVPPPLRDTYAEIEKAIDSSTSDSHALAAEGATWSYREALAEGRRALRLI